MTKKIYVVDAVVKKTGQGKFGPWTLVSVTDQDQVKYSTFKTEWLNRKGTEHEIEYEEKTETKDGRTYTNRNIVEPKAAPAPDKTMQYITDLYSKLKVITTQVERHSDDIAELREGRGASLGAAIAEMKKDENTDLPF